MEPPSGGEKATREQSRDPSERSKQPGETGQGEGTGKGDLRSQLLGMGFEEQKVKDIMAKNPKSRDEALEFILNVG